ncbi:hypothetical protein NM208_g3518 [Fusarium decemcellulare]|uniref:Uncharacterized protein n=1 Tax=Fusarium decemcellulare TaxID=57161 RepID=A0ACC1SNR1_9HYPO|nr:hypothetical protein NM208_g3518 [Fusarium decemcellulare]
MGINKDLPRPIRPSATDTTPPPPSSGALQPSSTASRRRTMLSEDYYNSWVEPSKYPRIPNVYEPIDDNQHRRAHGTGSARTGREKTKAIAVKLSIDNRHRSTAAHQGPDAEDWQAHIGHLDDQANWSVTPQLGSSYTWSDDFNFGPTASKDSVSREWPSSRQRRDSDEQRRAKRQSSFEKWMSAGDKLFCNSSKSRS